MKRAEKSMSVIYRVSTWLSLSLIIIATIEFIISGHTFLKKEIKTVNIISEMLSGNYYATYLAAIIILIFSPVISLFSMLITFILERKWRYSLLVFLLIVIMSIGAFLKNG